MNEFEIPVRIGVVGTVSSGPGDSDAMTTAQELSQRIHKAEDDLRYAKGAGTADDFYIKVHPEDLTRINELTHPVRKYVTGTPDRLFGVKCIADETQQPGTGKMCRVEIHYPDHTRYVYTAEVELI